MRVYSALASDQACRTQNNIKLLLYIIALISFLNVNNLRIKCKCIIKNHSINYDKLFRTFCFTQINIITCNFNYGSKQQNKTISQIAVASPNAPSSYLVWKIHK